MGSGSGSGSGGIGLEQPDKKTPRSAAHGSGRRPRTWERITPGAIPCPPSTPAAHIRSGAIPAGYPPGRIGGEHHAIDHVDRGIHDIFIFSGAAGFAIHHRRRESYNYITQLGRRIILFAIGLKRDAGLMTRPLPPITYPFDFYKKPTGGYIEIRSPIPASGFCKRKFPKVYIPGMIKLTGQREFTLARRHFKDPDVETIDRTAFRRVHRSGNATPRRIPFRRDRRSGNCARSGQIGDPGKSL